MSEVENEVNPVEELIDAIAAQNFNRAKEHFDGIIYDKMNDSIEQEKITVANQIFNNVEDDEEQLDLDLGDEELDDEDYVVDEEPEEDEDEEI